MYHADQRLRISTCQNAKQKCYSGRTQITLEGERVLYPNLGLTVTFLSLQNETPKTQKVVCGCVEQEELMVRVDILHAWK